MKNQRDLFIIIGLFVALILFIAFGPRAEPSPGDPDRPTTRSGAEGGALALYNWVDEMGYDAQRLEYRAFELGEQDDALFILSPIELIEPQEAQIALDWVDQGGTLILADDSPILFGNVGRVFEALDIEREIYEEELLIDRLESAQPVLDQPPFDEVIVNTERVLIPQRNDYAELIGSGDELVLAGIKYGRGYIYLATTVYPFTNNGLREEANAELVLNLLRRVPSGGRVLFDEYHHGFFTPPSTTTTIFSSPWGWAAAYATAAVALYLILSGRRFGKPIPIKEEVALRSSAEYVESMADLFQRGGKRGYILQHYHRNFKRQLARPYGVNPKLDDDAFVRELARFRDIDEAALLSLLNRLRSTPTNEAALVRIVEETEQTLASLTRR
ncbi:MAG: DUF4350 domain-containing protein [Chloroflexota bacterium]